MSQYFRVAMFDKLYLNQILVFDQPIEYHEADEKENYKYFCFYDLMDQSWWDNLKTNIMASLIYKDPTRVVWVGDYSNDSSNIKDYDSVWYKPTWNLNSMDCEEFFLEDAFTLNGKYIVNHDKKLYVDCDKYFKRSNMVFDYINGEREEVCVHPLPILTAQGNGLGGGDYKGSCMEYVGTWAADLISIEDELPASTADATYKLLDIAFVEEI